MSVKLMPIASASDIYELRQQGKIVVGWTGGAYIFDTKEEYEEFKNEKGIVKNNERDKFLTEAMGFTIGFNTDDIEKSVCRPYQFSYWNDFGKLWEWSIKQDWWYEFSFYIQHAPYKFLECIEPSKFADKVYKFLKEVKNETMDKELT